MVERRMQRRHHLLEGSSTRPELRLRGAKVRTSSLPQNSETSKEIILSNLYQRSHRTQRTLYNDKVGELDRSIRPPGSEGRRQPILQHTTGTSHTPSTHVPS